MSKKRGRPSGRVLDHGITGWFSGPEYKEAIRKAKKLGFEDSSGKPILSKLLRYAVKELDV